MAEYTGALADIPTAREYNGALEGDESASLLRRFVADPAISLLGKGAIGVPETAVGVADLVTGGRVGKLVEDAGIRFEDAKAFLDDYLSPEQKEANRVVQETKGFFPTVGAALSNPSTIVHSALESLPSMGAGGVVARGAIAALPKLAPVVAGALGEGVVSAGAGAEQIRQQTTDGLLTPKQAAIAAGSGAMTGGLSLAGGKIAQRLGVNDIDTILAGEVARQTGKAGVLSKAIEKGGMPARIAGGVVAEGVLEELPQSMQEQAAQNLALDKPVGEGVAEAGAMGMLAGGVMGGGSAAFQRRDPVEDAKAKAAAGDPAKAAQDLLKTAMSDVLNGTDNLGVNRDRKKPDTAAGQAPAAQKEIAGIPKVGERITLDMEGDRIFGELIAARQTPDGWIVRVKDDDGQVIEATEKDATIYQPPKLGDISVPNNALDLLASQGKRDLPARVHTPVGEGTRADPVKVETSADVEAAAKVASTDYTPPQGEANNVQRAHVAWQGLDGTIEVAAGGTRKGTNPETGEAWATSHTVPYGYWKGSKGADGMHVDAYFGPEIEANHPVYVIDELDNDGNYRQAKTLIGFPSEAAAREAYLGTSTKNPENIGGVASFPVDEFKQLLKDGRFDRPVTEDVINGKKKLSRAVEDADVQALDEYEDALQQPEDPVLSQLRGEGDRRMPGVGERLPDVSAGRGAGDRAETDAETRTGQEGQRPGISAGERALGDEDGKRTEHPEGRKTDAPRQDAGRAGVGEGTGAASVNDSKAPGEGLVSANGSGDGKTASRKGAQSAKPSVLDQIRTAAEATGKKPAAVKAQFLKDKEAHGEEEALKRLPKPKPAPKLLGKNAKGQSVYEDENGVRSFSDGGVMITETMGLTPTRDGIKVSRGELKPEFKTVEEIAAEKPKEEPKPLTDEEQAKLDIANAIADLGEILLTKTGGKLNITPEQEQKLLPVMTRLFDAAFRLGHIKFKAAARFVRDQIRKALGDETADLLTIEHYQGGYISMSARYRDKGSETAKERAKSKTTAIPATPADAAAATQEHLDAARNLTRSEETRQIIDDELARRARGEIAGVPDSPEALVAGTPAVPAEPPAVVPQTPPAVQTPPVAKIPVTPGPTPQGILALADSKGIPNDAAFVDFTRQLTGKEHLDELSPVQLQAVFNKLSARPDAGQAADLTRMANEAGWAQVGGKLLRDGEGASREEIAAGWGAQTGNVTGRTQWIPNAPWFQAMRQELGASGLSSKGEITQAVENLLSGKKLTARARRTLDWMLNDIQNEREFYAREQGVEDEIQRDITVADLLAEGLEPTGENLADMDLAATAANTNPDAFERAAIQFADDDAGFMAAVKEIINGTYQNTETGIGSAQGGGETQGGEAGPAAGAEEGGLDGFNQIPSADANADRGDSVASPRSGPEDVRPIQGTGSPGGASAVAGRNAQDADGQDDGAAGERRNGGDQGRQGDRPQDAGEVAQGGFDSEAWDRKREETIAASRAAGNVHLDKVPAYVETMRGREIFNVHDPKERGVIRTVANTGEVVVNWSDKYSGDKNLATERTEGTGRKAKTVLQTWLMPTDLKDYAFADKRPALDLSAQTPADLAAKAAQAEDETAGDKAIADRERDLYALQPQTGEREAAPSQQGDLIGAAELTHQPTKKREAPEPGGLFAKPKKEQAKLSLPIGSDYSSLKGKVVSIKIPVEGGESATLEMDAADALADVDDRIDLMRQLVECLA